MATALVSRSVERSGRNLNTPKGTVNWLRDFKKWCDENSLDKVLERFYTFVLKQVDGTDMSSIILKGNQMVFS